MPGVSPLKREGPLGCHVVPYTWLPMEKQLPPERVALCIQQILEVSLIRLLVLLSLATSPFYHSWQSGCRLHLVPRTVSLGRVHLGLSMLLHNSV